MVMLTQAQPATANVPANTAGVPATWSTMASAVALVDLAGILESVSVASAAAQWGIFYSGSAVFTSSHVHAVDLQQQYRTTDAPVENGAFLSYNKVRVPRQIVVEMLCDGSSFSVSNAFGNFDVISSLISTITSTPSGAQIVRSEFAALLENMVADLNVYQVATPEGIYKNMNVVGYSMRRSVERGITLIYADIAMEEVRLITASQYVSTTQPQGEALQSSGNVQSSAPTAAQLIAYQAGVP